MLHTTRPASGRARKLWDWFTRQELHLDRLTKAAGVAPDNLHMIRAGRVQRSAGAAACEIVYMHTSFYIFEVDEVLAAPARPVRSSDFFYL